MQLFLCVEVYKTISDLEVLLTWIAGRQQWCRKRVIICNLKLKKKIKMLEPQITKHTEK